MKYIENNLVMNHDGEWFAYYELIPYNYSFLSTDQKMQLHREFRQLVAQSRDGKLHALQIATESSVRQTQERCKKHVTGKLKEIAYRIIDEQTEAFIGNPDIGEYQVDYRFFLGFKLLLNAEEISLKKLKETAIMTFKDFIGEVNHSLMGDFLSVSNEEINRYMKIEKMLESKISRRFKFRRLTEKDFGYLVEHLYGQAVPYYEYDYRLPREKTLQETIVKKYDLLKLTGCLLEEHERYVKMTYEKGESYAAYLTIQTVTGDLAFPSSEVFYYQQKHFPFPVDTSMNVEIVTNKKALTTLRNKQKELKDLDEHAWSSGNDTEDSVMDALDSVKDLENELGKTKESMYKLSYVIRVAADTKEELEIRCDQIKDFYDDLNVKLVRPFGDMIGLQGEFIPSSKRYINDYVQYVTSDFLSGLGFGASRIIGEKDGIYIGYDDETWKNVYLDPALPCQGVNGSVTNALAMAYIGSLGGGKSFFNNLLVLYSVLYGAKALIVDPKSERGKWKEMLQKWKKPLSDIADEINIVNLTSEEENKGMLDPYIIMKSKKDAEGLVLDVLAFLTGISSGDGDRFPILRKAVRSVTNMETSGMLLVIDALRKMESPVSDAIAEHIESFTDYDFAQLLFSDGNTKHSIDLKSQLNIIQVQDLLLPEEGTEITAYTNMERLSVAVMIIISTFALDFIHSEREIFKIVDLDEAWSFLQVAQGKALSNKLVRAGRSMQAGVYFVTQNSDDLRDEKIKNNIGLKFAFRSTDIVEIKKTLTFFGLDAEDEENQNRLRNLKNGQCLMQDLYGHVSVVNIDPIFEWVLMLFDTRPPKSREG